MRFHYRHYRIPGPPVHHPGQFTAECEGRTVI